MRAVRTVTVKLGAEQERLFLVQSYVTRRNKSGFRQHKRSLLLGYGQQLRVTACPVGYIHSSHNFLCAIRLLQCIVGTDNLAVVCLLDQCVHSLEQYTVTTFEDMQVGIILLYSLCKQHKRPDSIAQVIRSFSEISVGGEQLLQLQQETRLAVFLRPVECAVHQFAVAGSITGHAHSGICPGRMIMHLVEGIVVGGSTVLDECRYAEKQIVLNARTALLIHPRTHTIVRHSGMHEPYRLVESLPEQLAGHG